MEREPNLSFQFPPGFRFHPSDEELIVHYLQNKVTSSPLPASIIAEIDLYKHNPWELPSMALFGKDEWYFFSPRDRKYPNGVRPNRAAASGFWKATGTDKPILTSSGVRSIGVKKALVFYVGKPPKGTKTDWIMNEYRLLETMIRPSRLKGSMRLDDWVLCRVRQKGNMSKNTCEGQDSPSTELVSHLPTIDAQPTYTNHNTGMFTDPLFKDCHQVIASILMYQDLPPIKTVSSVSFQGSNKGNSCSSLYEDISDKMKSPITVSSFDSFLNPSKRKKSIEGNRCANSPSKKQLTNNNKNEDPCGNTLGNDDMFYNQNQSQYNFFNPNPSNSIINLQDLTDELAFTEGYIQ